MCPDVPTADPFTQPWAGDGLPGSRELTREDLEELRAGLADFQHALGLPEEKPAEAKPEEDQASAELHCLVVAGYLGPGYGRLPHRTTTDRALVEACARHFGTGLEAPDFYPTEPLPTTVHVLVHSKGGSLDSAFKVVLFLRRFVKEVRVYVPSRAKSAATLIAVGADRIVMSPFAELGPLDTQITDPRNPTKHVSALDCYQSVDYVRDFGVQTVSRALRGILADTQGMVPLSELIATAKDFGLGSVEPMLRQVNALDFGGWGRTLKIGETYAKALRLRLQQPDTEEVADRISRKLVYGYTHHPYPIDLDEAHKIELTSATGMSRSVYLAARRVAAACKDDARFIGFAADVEQAIVDLASPRSDSTSVFAEPVPLIRGDREVVASLPPEPDD